MSVSEKRAGGKAPLYVVARRQDARAELSTGITLRPRDWNDKAGKVRKTHPQHVRLNRRVQSLLPEAQDELADLVPRRLKHGVNAPEHRERQDDVGVLGAFEVVA